MTAAGRATSRAKATKATSGGMLWSKPVATISAPKTKKVMTWRIALAFSANSTKPCGTSCSVAPIAIPQTKAAISPLPKVTSEKPEGDEREADRVDPLVARGQATARKALVQAAAEVAEAEPDHGPDHRLAGQLDGLRLGVAGW